MEWQDIESAQCRWCTRNGWYESFSGGFAHELPCERCNPQGLRPAPPKSIGMKDKA